VTLASIEGLEGTAAGSVYNAAKGGVVPLTKNNPTSFNFARALRVVSMSRTTARSANWPMMSAKQNPPGTTTGSLACAQLGEDGVRAGEMDNR
jgi:hypothetical protein